jgi:nitrate reductase NapE component
MFFLREIVFLLLLCLGLLLADMWCYQQGLPVELDEQGGKASLHVGSQTLSLGLIGVPVALQFASHDPLVHEYQLDGTDSTNNFTLDTVYLKGIADSPYYRFQSWMRDLDGTSRWSDLRISADGHILMSNDWPTNGSSVSLGSASTQTLLPTPSYTGSLRIQVMLRRPETSMSLLLTTADNATLQITLDRNDRKITVTRSVSENTTTVASAFFPIDVLPFAAMVMDTLLRTTLWAIVVLLVVLVCEVGIVGVSALWKMPRTLRVSKNRATQGSPPIPTTSPAPTKVGISFSARLTQAIHPIAFVMLVGSLCFVVWIAYVQYHGEPHIYDASAYLFAAKMYASGHLAVPVPQVVDRLPGPFMVQFEGQWFTQYAPGTALTLVPGVWLGVPWLVEPILGTFALLGIGLIAARLYDRRVATLAVALGTLSPFYSYLAASYLSHAVALFYMVWGLWALLRFIQGEKGWNLALAAFCFGMAGLTRDLVGLLFVATTVPGLLLLSWRQVRQDWRRWTGPSLSFLAIGLVFVVMSLEFDAFLTHSPWVTPRSLFFAGDHWGFGQGVGFYGQHTLAAGFVNLDELLTILAIDLYGWPFYLTLAFLALPFLARKAKGADWFLLVSTVVLTGVYVGYFYHGIYLGPRYLFETLPFLLMLTARGIVTLAAWSVDTVGILEQHWHVRHAVGRKIVISIPTVSLVTLLILCNLLYFLPRQVELHRNYSGLPSGYHIELDAVYHPPLHNALIVTDDYTIYQFVLFPLNDPLLHGDLVYAWASSAADYAELRAAFPGRQLYRLDIQTDGTVQYKLISH